MDLELDLTEDSVTQESIAHTDEVEVSFDSEDILALAPTLDFQTELKDSDGNLLRPGNFYLNTGYDAESGFPGYYILPISSAEYSDESQLRSIYFNDGEDDEIESTLLAEHTYSSNSHQQVRDIEGDDGEELDLASNSMLQDSRIPIQTKTQSKSKPRKRKNKSKDDGKFWDSNRTITLLQLMREHEEDFKLQVSRQRIEVWDAIAEEMRKYGYIDSTRQTCAKKWYNTKKKYYQLSGFKSKEKKWYCYKQVKYLIPVMKRSRQMPFIHQLSPASATPGPSSNSVKLFMDQIDAQNQQVADLMETYRIEKEILNQEQELYLDEIKKSLQERSERMRNSGHVASSSSSEAVVRTCDEIRNLLPIENCMEEMVELVDGENIIRTTSTTGEPIQLTVCLDWNQVSL